jgi:hypothetical protein
MTITPAVMIAQKRILDVNLSKKSFTAKDAKSAKEE